MPKKPVSLDVKVSGSRGKGLEKKLRQLKKMENIEGYKLGWPQGGKYPNGADMASVALWQEFGTRTEWGDEHIPERPFFRLANRKFKGIVAGLILKYAEEGVITEEGTRKLALAHIRLVQASLDIIKTPPLKTRVGGNPLVDTGTLKRHINYELIK